MKKIKLSLLFTCVILTACSSQIQATEALTETVSFQMEATEPLTPSAKPMTSQAIEPTPAYEMISNTSILSDTGILIEVREDTRITIDPIMGTQMEFGFRFSNVTEDLIPEHTMANSFSYFIEDIQFYRGEEEALMKLEKTGGGGGGWPIRRWNV